MVLYPAGLMLDYLRRPASSFPPPARQCTQDDHAP